MPFALQTATDLLAQIHLTLNPIKCEAWSPQPQVLPESFPCVRAEAPKVMRLHAEATPVVDAEGASPASQLPAEAPEMRKLIAHRQIILDALLQVRKTGLSPSHLGSS